MFDPKLGTTDHDKEKSSVTFPPLATNHLIMTSPQPTPMSAQSWVGQNNPRQWNAQVASPMPIVQLMSHNPAGGNMFGMLLGTLSRMAG